MRKRLGFFIGILFFSVASGQTAQRKEQLQKQNAELGFAVEKQRALDEKRQALDKLQAESLKKLSKNF